MKTTLITVILLACVAFHGCGSRTASDDVPPASTLPTSRPATMNTIRFLEDRIKRDPEDFIASNKVAGQYLQLMRETSDITYLRLASRSARQSLAVLPPEQNNGGLAALIQVELTSHEFASARDHALELIKLDPEKSYAYQFLGDALLELGDYDKAKAAYGDMVRFGGVQKLTRVVIEQRMARLATLRGDLPAARKYFINALKLALSMPAPSPETVAWCRWQLGETAFAAGDYATAERHYRDSLTTFPGYVQAVAALAKVRAAEGHQDEAIQLYEQAIGILPDLSFVAAAGDLYTLAGRPTEAAQKYALADAIGKLGGGIYNRLQVMYYADHDLKPQQAYENAKKEYEDRRDIYGSDAVAWTALKAGNVAEAQEAIKDALRLGTNDAKLFYHAGMIARASGNAEQARSYLSRALSVNPEFDPAQARIARKVLESELKQN